MKKQLLSLLMLGAVLTLKAQNPYPVIPVDTVQFVSPSKLPAEDRPDYINPTFKNTTYTDTVRFDGIVVTNPKVYGLSANRKASYIQREGGGPWSGVLVMLDNTTLPAVGRPTLQQFNTETKFYENMIPGYKVRITGRFAAFDNETQMNLMRNNPNWENSVEQVSLTPQAPVSTVITIDTLMTGNNNSTLVQQKVTGEKWEAVYVEIKNVTVFSREQNGSRWFWSVIDDNGNQLDIRDAFAYFRNDDNEDTIPKVENTFQPPVIGSRLSYIRGIVSEFIPTSGALRRYGLAPFNPADIGPCTVCPPSVSNFTRTPVVATPADSIEISAKVVAGSNALDSVILSYAIGAGSNVYTKVVMNGIGNNTFVGKIPDQDSGTIVKYWVKAKDVNGIALSLPDTIGLTTAFMVTGAAGVENIRQLQYSVLTSKSTIWNGDSIPSMDVKGVVTATRLNNQTVVQDGTGANSAIFIQNSDATTTWKVGDSVRISSGRVRENFNVTTLFNIQGSVLGSGIVPEPQTGLNMTIFATNNIAQARQWEGVLLRWDSVFVVKTNADSTAPTSGNFGEFLIKDTLGNSAALIARSMRVDDMSSALFNMNKDLVYGSHFEYVQGPMNFSFSNFKLTPRSLADIGMCSIDTIKPTITLLGDAPDTIEVGSAYMDAGATASDSRDGNISNMIQVTGTVNSNEIGTYTLQYNVTDYCGNAAASLTRKVIVVDTPNVGVKENELNAARLSLYPNPANGSITVDAKFIQTQPVTVTVVDILGRELDKRVYAKTEFTDVINTSNYNAGVYFCTISNANGSKTLKFLVSGK